MKKKNDLTIIEVGDILEGKIVNITKFVAFVELPGLKTGMIHISEIASNYVEDITQYVKIGQLVKVKVMSILDDKISLSMRQAK